VVLLSVGAYLHLREGELADLLGVGAYLHLREGDLVDLLSVGAYLHLRGPKTRVGAVSP